MVDYVETAFDYLTVDDCGVFYSGEKKWVNKMRKYAEEFPGKVRILKDDGNSIRAEVPKDWFAIRPKRRVALTDEQRKAAADRLRKARGGGENS